ncbi:MAG TPA: hypothetical protein VGN12_18790 [Pirellulales bacterium]|jgi:hypothetical protein
MQTPTPPRIKGSVNFECIGDCGTVCEGVGRGASGLSNDADKSTTGARGGPATGREGRAPDDCEDFGDDAGLPTGASAGRGRAEGGRVDGVSVDAGRDFDVGGAAELGRAAGKVPVAGACTRTGSLQCGQATRRPTHSAFLMPMRC